MSIKKEIKQEEENDFNNVSAIALKELIAKNKIDDGILQLIDEIKW